ncbi:MAG: diadenylate cyclase CdaA [Candidatus Cloacimonadaceae bacterium]
MSFLIPQFKDIIDILIIGFLIYQALLLIRKTGNYTILYGLFFIVMIYSVAIILKLEMVSELLNAVKTLWIFVLVILFQPEIRQLFSKIHISSDLIQQHTKNTNRDFNSSLIDAISAMSFRRIGALIVLARKKKMNEYINAGEIIDSVLSLRLILSIFNTKSVLHDGAIIVRDGRIKAAKVVLPLSSNPQYKLKFGTRHLAAIGISEVTDALAIVVSEQTGRVSIASDGLIQTDVAFEELMQIVTDATK